MLKCSAKDNCYDKSEGGPSTSSLQTLRENLEKVVEFPALKTAEPRFAIAENSDTGPMSEIFKKVRLLRCRASPALSPRMPYFLKNRCLGKTAVICNTIPLCHCLKILTKRRCQKF